MKEKATIFDYARMCKGFRLCESCPLTAELNEENMDCEDLVLEHPEEANEIILKWCEEHPVETRQSKLLKCYPYIPIVGETVDICPKIFDTRFLTDKKCYKQVGCSACKRDYWLAEVGENGNT